MLTQYLVKLQHGHNLTRSETQEALRLIIDQSPNPLQVGAFLSLMRAKNETCAELLGFIDVMQAQMITVPTTQRVLDIVGTGGDKAHTLNISTAASLLVASAGVPIAKHGNRCVSSKCGSADVLEALGVCIDKTPEQVSKDINQHHFAFCFAPHFHPAMAALKTTRKALNIPTTFNVLGPLLNPAHAQHLLLGVYDQNSMQTIAQVLAEKTMGHSWVVHSQGLDELTTIRPARVLSVCDGQIDEQTLNPTDYGFRQGDLADLRGHDASFNSHAIRAVFAGQKSTFSDTVLLNAGVALTLYGRTSSIFEGIACARQLLQSGAALAFLEQLTAH